MIKAQGFKLFLAALCVSAAAMDSAAAQDAAPSTVPPQIASPDAQDDSQAGWLLRGRGQKRIANPFRTTPAPGTQRAQSKSQAGALPSIGSGTGLPNAVVPQPQSESACLTGYRRQGTECVAVEIPANATLDFTGHGWMCQRGFQRQGQGCVALSVPQNASLTGAGNTWVCNSGFRRQGPGCVAIVVPEHASLDKTGHAWACDYGYTQRGQACIDDATARLQQQADRAVAAKQGSAPAAPQRSITVNSGENRNGRTSKAKVVIGRF